VFLTRVLELMTRSTFLVIHNHIYRNPAGFQNNG